MITLRANHQILSRNTESSYLTQNYSSGVSTIVVTNADVFADNDFLLLGEWGSETAEIVQINGTPNTTTQTIILESATKFSHSESTKVSIIKYNQVRFYRNTTATFNSSAGNALTGYVDIQPDDHYTNFHDLTNSTGYGFYVFYDSETATTSSPSNAMPYADFVESSVKAIFDHFNSLLNNKEISLINTNERFLWLNEANSRAQNELNLVNQDYTVPTLASVSITSGTAEYDLATAFGQLISITNSNGTEIPHISLRKELANDTFGNQTYYYIRGTSLGITPTPTADTTYYLYYTQKTTRLTSLYDNVAFPNNNYYFLVYWMMYKAAMKLKKPMSEVNMYKNEFEEGIKMMKITSINQSAERRTWGIDEHANV